MKLIFILCKLDDETFLFKLSEVTLKLKVNGNTKIFSDDFFQKYNDCEIYLNNTLENNATNTLYLNTIF